MLKEHELLMHIVKNRIQKRLPEPKVTVVKGDMEDILSESLKQIDKEKITMAIVHDPNRELIAEIRLDGIEQCQHFVRFLSFGEYAPEFKGDIEKFKYFKIQIVGLLEAESIDDEEDEDID